MTLIIMYGRRTPRNWLRRTAFKAGGLLTLQENAWVMINQSINLAKKKTAHVNDGRIYNVTHPPSEVEDISYQIEWLKIIIQATKEIEEEEYNEAMKSYEALNKVIKGEVPKDDRMGQMFKTKLLGLADVEEAFKKGRESLGKDSIANKLNELGIMLSIKKIKDFENRITS